MEAEVALEHLNSEFSCILVSADSIAKKYTVRAALTDLSAVTSFIKKFGILTNSSWIVRWDRHRTTSPTRHVLHKSWSCQRAAINKSKQRESSGAATKCTNCPASLDVRVKLVTKATKKRDPFLQRDPPLVAIIVANLQHNHSVASADSLRYLPLSDEVKHKFMEYFNDGLGPSEAKRAHENALLMGEHAVDDLANACLNPTTSTLYRLHRQWKASNSEDVHHSPTAESDSELLSASNCIPLHLTCTSDSDATVSASTAGNVITTPDNRDVLQAFDSSVQQLQEAVSKVAKRMRNQASEVLVKHLNNLTHKLNGAATANASMDLVNAMSAVASKCVRHGSAIRVQPTALAIRHEGVVTRLASGQPSSCTAGRSRKRPHNLTEPVRCNVASS